MDLSHCGTVTFISKSFHLTVLLQGVYSLPCTAIVNAAITRGEISGPPAEKQDTWAESPLQPYQIASPALLKWESCLERGTDSTT